MASHRVRLSALLFSLSAAFAPPALADPVATCGAPGPSASASAATSAGAHVISSVPAYSWYHGCGPTAAASVLGYWDLAGYRNLFTASAPDIFSTPSVQDQISSPAHNAKYDPSPDAPGPAPASTSIADWFQTSVDPLDFGWSFLSFAEGAVEGYAAYRGYQFEAQTRAIAALSDGFSFSWDDAVREIDSGRPFLSLVDTDGNGATDHFVPVLGYDDRGPLGRFYGFYTTWDEPETISNRYQVLSLLVDGRGRVWGTDINSGVLLYDGEDVRELSKRSKLEGWYPGGLELVKPDTVRVTVYQQSADGIRTASFDCDGLTITEVTEAKPAK